VPHPEKEPGNQDYCPRVADQIQNDVGIRHSKERNLVVIAFATMAQSTYL
jgi:hypothetical protein